jgi:hypothetical protein
VGGGPSARRPDLGRRIPPGELEDPLRGAHGRVTRPAPRARLGERPAQEPALADGLARDNACSGRVVRQFFRGEMDPRAPLPLLGWRGDTRAVLAAMADFVRLGAYPLGGTPTPRPAGVI